MTENEIKLSSAIDIEIDCYKITGDELYYNNHVFVIKVWINQQYHTIERSYFAFCLLDSNLRRQYARSSLPILSLVGAQRNAKSKRKVAEDLSSSNSIHSVEVLIDHWDMIDQRNSFSNSNHKSRRRRSSCKKPVKRLDSNNSEVISNKKVHLQDYLKALLLIPEVVMSETWLYFLDAESVDGEIISNSTSLNSYQSNSSKIISDESQNNDEMIDILLSDQPVTSRLVRKDFSLEFDAQPENNEKGSLEHQQVVIVWKFSTARHDIGFSIGLNGDIALPYQRYNSHERHVRGCFEVPTSNKVQLIWDNSYSRWRAKSLKYSMRIASRSDLDEAQKLVTEKRKQMQQFAKQRVLVKKALHRLAAELMSRHSMYVPSINGAHIGFRPSLNELSSDLQDNSESKIADANVTDDNSTTSKTDLRLNAIAQKLSSQQSIEIAHQIYQLQEEKNSLQKALGDAESSVVAERTAAARNIMLYEEAQNRAEMAEDEVNELRSELELYREESNSCITTTEKNTVETWNSSIDRADTNSEIAVDTESAYSYVAINPSKASVEELLKLPPLSNSDDTVITLENLKVLYETMRQYSLQITTEISDRNNFCQTLEAQIIKLKTEKKQLRNFALQMKENSEKLEQAVAQEQHEKSLLVSETQMLRNALAEKDSEIKKMNEISEEHSNTATASLQNSESWKSYNGDADSFQHTNINEGNECSATDEEVRNSPALSQQPDVISQRNDSSFFSGTVAAVAAVFQSPLKGSSASEELVNINCKGDSKVQSIISSAEVNENGSVDSRSAVGNNVSRDRPLKERNLVRIDFSSQPTESEQIVRHVSRLGSKFYGMLPTFEQILGVDDETLANQQQHSAPVIDQINTSQ